MVKTIPSCPQCHRDTLSAALPDGRERFGLEVDSAGSLAFTVARSGDVLERLWSFASAGSTVGAPELGAINVECGNPACALCMGGASFLAFWRAQGSPSHIA